MLAGAAHEPVGGILAHSLLTWRGARGPGRAAGCVSTVLVAALVAAPAGRRIADVAAAGGSGGAGVDAGGTGLGSTAQTILLAPLCALAAGVLVLRLCGLLLVAGERAARRGPVAVRIAFVGLARRPALPSLWVAFVAVAVGLGGFALSYRATLERSASDQAAAAVPLDAIVSPGPSFATPLMLAPARPLGRAGPRRRLAGAPDPGHVRQWRRVGHRPRPRRARGGAGTPARVAAVRRLRAAGHAGAAPRARGAGPTPGATVPAQARMLVGARRRG